MTGHPLFPVGREKVSAVCVSGSTFRVHVSYHRAADIDGYIVGIKFADDTGSMDSAKRGNFSPHQIGRAVGQQAMHLVRADLEEIAILGFYLLTDDLEKRGKNAVAAKRRLYDSQALILHEGFKDRLPEFTTLEASGGIAWAMSRKKLEKYPQYNALVEQLGKQLQVSHVS